MTESTETTTHRIKVAVLVSGKGTNLQALIDAASDTSYPAEIALVISDKEDAFSLQRAKRSGIETKFISPKSYPDREKFDQAMHQALLAKGIECVCMAGFMRLLSGWFVREWHNKLINIHPSLLPAFKGLNAQKQAIDYGVKVAGCTVHFVRETMDEGPIIMQKAVDVYGDDTPETLNRRILAMEHVAFVEVLELYAHGRLRIENEHVFIGAPQPSPQN